MYKVNLNSQVFQIDKSLSDLQMYLKENTKLIFVLSTVALAAYGFELFNLNLSIDEEIHATYSAPTLGWISQGRWGMYLLNKFIMPYTIIPFIPLFIALIFHIIATLLILRSWEVTSEPDKFIVGAIYVTFPTMAYMYTFSTINYGIGIGLFCIALSLFIYSSNEGLKRFFAVLPASFAIAIYQGFIPALVAVFLVYIILMQIRTGKLIVVHIINMAFISILSLLIYYVVQKFILMIGIVPGLTYVSDYFDVGFLQHYFYTVLTRIWLYLFLPVYLGGESVYSINMRGIGVLLFVSFIGLFVNLLKSKLSTISKILVTSFLLVLLILPFISGFLMQGYMSLRFLVALPTVIAGLVTLGMLNGSKNFKIFVVILASYCIFQFVTSTNHLFASSHLALEADRMLASRLIGRIEDVQAETDTKELRYIEIIGYYSRPSTELIPKIETFGASFFEWDQGNPYRILPFLQTIGFEELQPLPLQSRGQMIKIADLMPVWPDKDSIKIIDNIVLVKFGPYSSNQKQIICSSKQSKSLLQDKSFCR